MRYSTFVPSRPRSRLAALLAFLLMLPVVAGTAGSVDEAQLDSKEYKILLKKELFVEDREKATNEFWGRVAEVATKMGLEVSGKLGKEEIRRVRFLDTHDFSLRKNSFVFRERLKIEDGKAAKRKKITLKFRGETPDKAAAVDVSTTKGKDPKVKLEEDIVPPAKSKFSKSGSTKVKKEKVPETAKQLRKAFPSALTGLDVKEGDLVGVNGFRAYEIKVEGPLIDLGSGVKAEPSFTFWRDKKAQGKLLAVEFSYALEVKGVPNSSKDSAGRLFAHVLIELDEWIDPNARTKTQIAYEFSGHLGDSER